MMSFFSRFFQNKKVFNKNEFIKNPKQFLALHPINAFQIFTSAMKKSDFSHESKTYFFTLSSDFAKEKEVFLTVDFEANAHERIEAYLLKYESSITNKSDIPFLTLPKNNPSSNFVFTPTLTGCSIIIEDHENHYRIYHEPREPNLNEYQNVIGVFHHKDMTYPDPFNRDEINTLGFGMLFYEQKTSQWVLLGQSLQFAEFDKKNAIQHFALNKNKKNPVEIQLTIEFQKSFLVNNTK